MMVLSGRKFNEEQLLLKTYSPKMHIELPQKTNNFFLFHIYFNVIDNSLSAHSHSHCYQISYFMACIVGGYATTYYNGAGRNIKLGNVVIEQKMIGNIMFWCRRGGLKNFLGKPQNVLKENSIPMVRGRDSKPFNTHRHTYPLFNKNSSINYKLSVIQAMAMAMAMEVELIWKKKK